MSHSYVYTYIHTSLHTQGGNSNSSNNKHVVRLHDSFKLGEHLCLVMEAMGMNLRRLLKTYGGSQGIAVKAVSALVLDLFLVFGFGGVRVGRVID